jgi:hypothetical protein
MSRHSYPDDPEKGMPHRHARAKIRLLLQGPSTDLLEEMLLKIAETHPDAVLDAVAGVLAKYEDYGSGREELPAREFRRNAAIFISRNDGLLARLAGDSEGDQDDALG